MTIFDRLSLGVHASGASPRDAIAVARALERAGWWGISIGDSALDSFAALAAVAAATERLHLRNGVAILGRTPVQTATAAATVDELAPGRYRLGLGTGSRERTSGWHDIDYGRIVGRFRDYVSAVRAAWATTPGAPASYEGPFYRFRGYARLRPPATPSLPIDLAANGPQMLRLAGALGDGVMFNDLHTGPFLRDVALPAVEAGERHACRPVGTARRIGAFLVSLGPSKAAAIARGRAGVQAYLVISHNRHVLEHYGRQDVKAAIERALADGDSAAVARAIPDDLVDLFALCGDATEIRRRLAAYDGVLDEAILHIPEWRVPGAAAVAAYFEVIEALAPR
ncbi:MAG: LLM class flavin-dependent oxidoreductase [Dehalococcoidia bacterium]|nr:LLM class flavin-dependent oxidoreductase [Dehalococcoidia bacterium]